MRALLGCLLCWLICSLLTLTFASFPLPLSVRRELLAKEGWAQSLVCLCCATTCSYQPWASLIKTMVEVLWPPSLSDLWDIPLFPASSPSFCLYCSFLGPFFSFSMAFWTSKLMFPNSVVQVQQPSILSAL